MTDGVVSTPVGVIEPGRAIASGWGFLLTRPGVVLLWAAIGFVPALGLLWFLSDLYAERLTANGYLGFAPVALAILTGPINFALQGAGLRSALMPDDGRMGYVRLGGREFSLMTMGWSRDPNNLPFGPILLLMLLTIAVIGTNVLIIAIGAPPLLMVNVVLLPVWVGALFYAKARASLATVAAFAGWTNAQSHAWERSRGKVGLIVLAQIGAWLGWAGIAVLIAWTGWLAVEAVGGFSPEAAPWPFGPTPGALVAAAFAALATALYHALCTRPLAVVWRMLVGTRRDRNFLAEVTG